MEAYPHKVSSLYHEVLDDTMEARSFVSYRNTILAVFSCTKLAEVLTSFRCNICKQFHYQSSNLLKCGEIAVKNINLTCILAYLKSTNTYLHQSPYLPLKPPRKFKLLNGLTEKCHKPVFFNLHPV